MNSPPTKMASIENTFGNMYLLGEILSYLSDAQLNRIVLINKEFRMAANSAWRTRLHNTLGEYFNYLPPPKKCWKEYAWLYTECHARFEGSAEVNIDKMIHGRIVVDSRGEHVFLKYCPKLRSMRFGTLKITNYPGTGRFSSYIVPFGMRMDSHEIDIRAYRTHAASIIHFVECYSSGDNKFRISEIPLTKQAIFQYIVENRFFVIIEFDRHREYYFVSADFVQADMAVLRGLKKK